MTRSSPGIPRTLTIVLGVVAAVFVLFLLFFLTG